MKYRFERDPENGVIFVIVKLDDNYTFKMLLDTGASHTTFDTNALYMAYYPMGKLETSVIETANGIVKVDIFEASNLTALGHTVYGKPVQVYDFLAHGILTDYEGVLGIDFFENTVFCIDMINNTIEIHNS